MRKGEAEGSRIRPANACVEQRREKLEGKTQQMGTAGTGGDTTEHKQWLRRGPFQKDSTGNVTRERHSRISVHL